MIGARLKACAGDEKYIFLEFKPRIRRRSTGAVAVADKLVAVAESRKTAVEKSPGIR